MSYKLWVITKTTPWNLKNSPKPKISLLKYWSFYLVRADVILPSPPDAKILHSNPKVWMYVHSHNAKISIRFIWWFRLRAGFKFYDSISGYGFSTISLKRCCIIFLNISEWSAKQNFMFSLSNLWFFFWVTFYDHLYPLACSFSIWQWYVVAEMYVIIASNFHHFLTLFQLWLQKGKRIINLVRLSSRKSITWIIK